METDNLRSFVRTAWGIDYASDKAKSHVHFLGNYVLKSGTDAALHKSVRTSLLLLNEGIPVAEPILSLSGDYVVQQEETSYMLSRRLQGTHIDIFSDKGAYFAENIGRQTALLHRALFRIENELTLTTGPFAAELQGWIVDTLKQHRWHLISQEDFQTSTRGLLAFYDSLPQQPIHRDVHCGNMLFVGEEFGGFIDFDLAKRDVRIFDCAYFLSGLLANVQGSLDGTTIDRWMVLCSSFLNGYRNVAPWSNAEREAFPYLLACIEILFIASSLRNNQPELARVAHNLYRLFVAQHRALVSIL